MLNKNLARVETSRSVCTRLEKGANFPGHVLTRDETWVHFNTLKQSSNRRNADTLILQDLKKFQS